MEAAAREMIAPHDVATIEVEAHQSLASLRSAAEALTIATGEDAEYGDLVRSEIVTRRKAIEGWFAPLVDAAHRAHKQLCERRNSTLAPFLDTERVVAGKLVAWHTEQERLRREAEETALRAAREEAERQQMAAAERALDGGDMERAEAILESPPPPVLVPRPTVAAPPKLATTGFSQRWRAEVYDLRELVRAVADGRAPLECIEANMTALNGLARSLKGGMSYPGVRAVAETGVRTTRSAR